MIEIATKCAICGTYDNSTELYPATNDSLSFSVATFSARRIPDRRHYRWVRCNKCSLLRSDPVFNINLGDLYEKSSFDYQNELSGLKKTYIKILRKAFQEEFSKKSLLEIGGGNGFFMEKAKDSGFSSVRGVEPSIPAAAEAREDIRPLITVGLMKEGLFADASFDVIAMFHVMDHLPDPLDLLTIAKPLLKSGGIFLMAVHNTKAISARVLGRHSPIYDVEHTYLYSKKTAKKLFEAAGYSNVICKRYSNHYSGLYLIQLIPIKYELKVKLMEGAFGRLAARLNFVLPLGNIWVSGEFNPQPNGGEFTE